MEERLLIRDVFHFSPRKRQVFYMDSLLFEEELTIEQVYEKYGDVLTEKQIQYLENERTKQAEKE